MNIIIYPGAKSLIVGLCLLLLSARGVSGEIPDITIPSLGSLVDDLKLSASSRRPLLLIFSAEHCYFCERLKENIIKPMLRSGDYDEKVIIRVVEIDNHDRIINQQGKPMDVSALASLYDIRVTPTVLLIGPDGSEIAERQLGINSEDYYGVYLDNAIAEGIRKIEQSREQMAR
jgi:thioredoxin-related protein